MVQYKSSNVQYPGDEKMRTTTLKNKHKRLIIDESAIVSYNQYLDEKQPRGKKTRLCTGDLDLLREHINSMTRVGAGTCQWCGKQTFMRCNLCKKHVCLKSGGNATSLSCCIDFHDDLKYGLGLIDRKEIFGVGMKYFKKAGASEVKKNAIHMKELMMKYFNNIEEN
jgi:hypothetical protein